MYIISESLFRCKHNLLLRISKYSSKAVKQTPAEYCLNLVKKHDYENFLCTLLATHRHAAFVVHAFNVEIALVRDQVRDYKIGEMRLKFWTDALNKVYEGNPPKTPVLLELHRVLQRYPLSKHYFKRLIDIRLEKLRDYLFNDLSAIEKYAEYSTSSIYYLLLEAHGITNINADHAASHMGKAHGIINLLRSVPYNARKRINMLPQDILMKHSVSTEAVLQGHISKDLQNVIYDVASQGKIHLDLALSLINKIDKRANVIFLPVISLNNYLEKLRKVDFNVFDVKLQKGDNLLPLRLLWKKWWW